MKKHIFSLFALLVAVHFSWASTVTTPANIPAYYAAANGKSGSSLYTAINTITNVGFSSLGYDGALTAYQTTDVYPSDPTHPDYVASKVGKLWDMYGGCSFDPSDNCGNYSGECDCYNREHSVPKSWWGGSKNNMYSDIFHLVPTDGYVNNRRSNYAFGEVSGTPTYEYNDCKLGSPAAVSTDHNTLAGTSATCSASPVFEPRDEYKGDFARGYLGMIAKYSNSSYSITSGNGGAIFTSFSSSTFGLTNYGIVLLMKWHREDPVSRKEIDRNNGIQATQGNRNPFIDYPYLAEFIWGEKAGETVDMSLLMPSTDTAFVAGVSNGWRGETTPIVPVTTTKYGVTWYANGTFIRTDSVAQNNAISSLPDAPASCSETSNVFVGWTTTPISGYTDDEPAVLYTQLSDFPAVTEDITYYAVYAHADSSTVEGTAETLPTYLITMSEQNLTSGAAVSTIETDEVTITFSNAKYYDNGTAVRVYGGGTMKVTSEAMASIQLTFGADDKSNEITTDCGTYDATNGLWQGSANEVTFTVGGTSGHRKIASVEVMPAGSVVVTTYSAYITSCPETTELVNTPLQQMEQGRLILIGGHVYIQLGEQLYNTLGQRIR